MRAISKVCLTGRRRLSQLLGHNPTHDLALGFGISDYSSAGVCVSGEHDFWAVISLRVRADGKFPHGIVAGFSSKKSWKVPAVVLRGDTD